MLTIGRRSLLAALPGSAWAASFGVQAREAGAAPQQYGFSQVDVFTGKPLLGNPVAVVIAADQMPEAEMASLSRWTNLSETTFLMRPTNPQADYRLRIFAHGAEFPFAGHPTLGSCHVWLSSGGVPKSADVVQECGIGLVRLRREGERLAFMAPVPTLSAPVEPEILAKIRKGLGLAENEVLASRRLVAGVEWIALMLPSRDRLLALRPDWAALNDLAFGVIAPWPKGDADFEVRAFAPKFGNPEDPVTGSLNGSLAHWLIGSCMAPDRYVVSQGAALGRNGRIHVQRDTDGVWIGGEVADCISGHLAIS